MSIVTKTGDHGETSLMYGRRVSKNDPRVDACGCVDELMAALGLARATSADKFVAEQIFAAQKDLIVLMGELATAPQDRQRYGKAELHETNPEILRYLNRLSDLCWILARYAEKQSAINNQQSAIR